MQRIPASRLANEAKQASKNPYQDHIFLNYYLRRSKYIHMKLYYLFILVVRSSKIFYNDIKIKI